MRWYLAIFLACSGAGMAQAGCPAGSQVVLSCLARGATGALDVCIERANGIVSYSYGPMNGPAELSLSEPIKEVEHRPWPGIGRSIWETTVFRNAGYVYEVFSSVDRMDRDQPVTGGVLLYKGGKEIARVDCDAGTVEMGLWAVTDAKEALGLCWDQGGETWNACAE